MRRTGYGALAAALAVLGAPMALGGPPFITDDPEPVEPGHWEVYLTSQWAWAPGILTGSAPQVEVNYGAAPSLQLHALVPGVFSAARGTPLRYGLGDIELGAKYRFLEEAEGRPQVGTFPLLEVPSGSEARGLGSGKWQALLPVWLQKSWGPWTTYGGGGLRLASGGERALSAGWLVQRTIAPAFTVGAEVFATVPLTGGAAVVQANVGMIFDATEHHHILASVGPSFGTGPGMQACLAYQWTH